MSDQENSGRSRERNSDASLNSTPRTGIEREFAERTALDAALQTQAAMWRDEVALRVNSYRARRSKKTLAGDFSMKFDFDRPEPKAPAMPPPMVVSDAAPVSAESRGGELRYENTQVSSAFGSANLGHQIGDLGYQTVASPGYLAQDPHLPTSGRYGAPSYQAAVEPPAREVASAVEPPPSAAAGAVRPPVAAPPAAASPVPSRALVQTEQALRVDEYLASVFANAQVAPDVLPTSTPPREEREAKVIEFPRALVYPDEAAAAAQDSSELAESIFDTPRILDVPDTVSVTAPPLADLSLDAESDEAPVRPPEFDLPLKVAPLPHRFSAALLDWMIVLAATGVFGVIVMRGASGIPHTKPILGLALAMPMLFWAVYHWLFLSYSACTPGMQMAGLRISTFQGGRASWRLRRWRALMMVLSGASLGFGFLWALFDEDCLGWHDRMTRTYVTLENHRQ